jgi:hypothetical protein
LWSSRQPKAGGERQAGWAKSEEKKIKGFPLDLEEIIVGDFDVEGGSTKKVRRVIHSTSIV